MRCERIKELMIEHLDGCLDAEHAREMTDHLSGCAACRRELEELRQTVTLLRDMPPVVPPPDIVASVHRRLVRRSKSPLVMAWHVLSLPQTRMAAAAALVMLVGVYGWRTLTAGQGGAAGERGYTTARATVPRPAVQPAPKKPGAPLPVVSLSGAKSEKNDLVQNSRSEAPRDKPRGIFAEPSEAKSAIPLSGKPDGFLAKEGETLGVDARLQKGIYSVDQGVMADRSAADKEAMEQKSGFAKAASAKPGFGEATPDSPARQASLKQSEETRVFSSGGGRGKTRADGEMRVAQESADLDHGIASTPAPDVSKRTSTERKKLPSSAVAEDVTDHPQTPADQYAAAGPVPDSGAKGNIWGQGSAARENKRLAESTGGLTVGAESSLAASPAAEPREALAARPAGAVGQAEHKDRQAVPGLAALPAEAPSATAVDSLAVAKADTKSGARGSSSESALARPGHREIVLAASDVSAVRKILDQYAVRGENEQGPAAAIPAKKLKSSINGKDEKDVPLSGWVPVAQYAQLISGLQSVGAVQTIWDSSARNVAGGADASGPAKPVMADDDSHDLIFVKITLVPPAK